MATNHFRDVAVRVVHKGEPLGPVDGARALLADVKFWYGRKGWGGGDEKDGWFPDCSRAPTANLQAVDVHPLDKHADVVRSVWQRLEQVQAELRGKRTDNEERED